MIIIGIGGAHSGVGKTTLATGLIRYFSKKQALKRYGMRWGAIKYTRSDFYSSVTNDIKALSAEDKDTARLLQAGATDVYWIQCPSEQLNECIPIAIEGFTNLDGLVVEGNSAVEFLKPDVVVFLHSHKEMPLKETASRLIKKADILIHISSYDSKKGLLDRNFDLIVKDIDSIDIQGLCKMIEAKLIDREIKDLLLKNINEDRKITCAKAREIAETLSIPYEQVGKMANEMNIKIIKCELGCF